MSDGTSVLQDCNSEGPNRLVIPMHSSNEIGHVYYTNFQSPVGQLLLAGNDRGLRLISFAAGKHVKRPQPGWMENKDAGGGTPWPTAFADVPSEGSGSFESGFLLSSG
jgi:hypothetical protein